MAEAEARLLELYIARDRAAVGGGDLHHRGHRDARRAGQRGGDRRRDGAGAEGDALRRPRSLPAELGAQDGPAQVEPGAAGALRRREARGAHPARRRARGDVRPRQVLPGGQDRRRLPRSRRALEHPRRQPRPQAARDGLDRLALDRARRCAPSTSASSSSATRARASSATPNLGELWRSKYDMPPEAFAAELDRLWGQVKPLYDSLHCYVRAALTATVRQGGRPAGRRRSRRTCSATCGRSSGATSTTW